MTSSPGKPRRKAILPLTATDHGPRQDSQGHNDDESGDDHIQNAPLCPENQRRQGRGSGGRCGLPWAASSFSHMRPANGPAPSESPASAVLVIPQQRHLEASAGPASHGSPQEACSVSPGCLPTLPAGDRAARRPARLVCPPSSLPQLLSPSLSCTLMKFSIQNGSQMQRLVNESQWPWSEQLS